MRKKISPSILMIIILISGCLSQKTTLEEVTIYRDIYGVPHIFSESDEGVFYGFGYAQAEEMMLYLIHSYQKNGEKIQEPNLKKAFELLANWDFVVRMDSTEPLLFLSFLNFLEKEIELPEPEKMDKAQQELVISSLEKAVEEMLRIYQRIDVLWGDVHVMKRGDKVYPLSSGMNLGTLHHAEGGRKNGIWYCDRGSSYMLLVELSQPVRAWSLRPLGQSEDENSLHYDDMTELYSQMKYKPFFFEIEDILSNLESKKILRFEKPKVVV